MTTKQTTPTTPGRTVVKGHPMWCRVYARKTPSIPVHNGFDTCIGCGFDVAAYRAAQKETQS